MTTKTAYSYLRFSTPEQAFGDSERRQLAEAQNYCQRNGLRLVDTVADKGLSAYRGRNHTTGNLGRLLKAMKPGDVLLIEDNNRFSREPALDAMNRLQAAVQAGIEVHFLRTDTRVNASNFGDMSVLVPNFFSALLSNLENDQKANWTRKTWAGKRQALASGQAVRLGCSPCWLKWDKDQQAYTLDSAKAVTVKIIFERAAAGVSVVDIVRGLQDTPPITGTGKGWNSPFLRDLLGNKAAIGLCAIVKPPVKIYPPIINESLFYTATAHRPGVGCRARVRRSASATNLFTGLIHCGQCGEPVVCHDPGRGYPRGLVCSGSRTGRSRCHSHSVPMAVIEAATLSFLGDADAIRPLLCAQAPDNRLEELAGRLASAQKQSSKLAAVIISDPEPVPAIYAALKSAQAEAEQTAQALEEERIKVQTERPAQVAYDEFVASLPALARDGGQRGALRQAIGLVVERIVLDPAGETRHGYKRWNFVIQLRGAKGTAGICALRNGQMIFQSFSPYPRTGGNLA